LVYLAVILLYLATDKTPIRIISKKVATAKASQLQATSQVY